MAVRKPREKRGHQPEHGPDNASTAPLLKPSLSMIDRIVNAAPLVGLIGAALYGMLRLAYLFFYLRLRASPDEVGYGYSQVLADELIGAIELVLLMTLILMLPGAVLVLSLRLPKIVKELPKLRLGKIRLKLPRTFDTDRWIRKAKRLALWSLAGAIPLVVIGLPILGWLEGENAANGYTVRNVYLLDFIPLPVLAVEAVPAKVTWIAPSGAGEADIAGRQCLLYLGQSDGTAVFYDVQSKESIRLPNANIIITLQDTVSVPIGCT